VSSLPKRILLTGAGGFIGSRLLRRLASPDREIVAVTRNARRIAALPGIRPLALDIAAPDFPSLLPQVDAVVHLAALLDLSAPPELLRRVNVEATEKLAQWASRAGVPYFLHASSLEAQGPSEAPLPQGEDAACRPVSSYGRSKLESEGAVSAHLPAGNLMTARFGNVYGPGSTALIEPLLRLGGDPETMSRIGSFRVQPIHVDDLAILLETALRNKPTGLMNLAGPEETSFADITAMITSLLGPLKHAPAGPAASFRDHVLSSVPRVHRLLSIDRQKKILPVLFRYDLLKGTAYTLEWLLQRPRG